MSGLSSLRMVAAAAALACLSALPAHAASGRSVASTGPGSFLTATYIDVNLAGFQSAGDFGDPGNTAQLFSVGAGATVTGWDYLNLSYTTQGSSWLSEFVISVNNSDGSAWFDATLSDIDDGGTFGPASGTFGVDTPLFDGSPFVVTDGNVLVTTYELFDDDGVDSIVGSGTLRIYYTPAAAVPEPSTYGLMALGLLAVAGAARRRKAD